MAEMIDIHLALARHSAILRGVEFSMEETRRICLDENGCGRSLRDVALVWGHGG